MKILYDNQIFGIQKFGGISRYFVELFQNLESEYSIYNTTILSDNHYLRMYDPKFRSLSWPENIRGKFKIYNLINSLSESYYLNCKRYDIIHPTYYFCSKSIMNSDNKIVLTVHDMIHELFAESFENDKTIIAKAQMINRADKIIAVSHNTKNDIIKLLGIDEDKIDVVYHGYTSGLSNRFQSTLFQGEKYILYVGSRDFYKNFYNLLRAFSLINLSDLKLVCVGKPFTLDELKLIDRLNLKSHVFAYNASDSELGGIYKNAQCFVYPSFYEGFGIPILEAFSCNCPVVLSSTSCFPEIAKDAGVYFDPYSIESMAEALKVVLKDSSLRKKHINMGRLLLNDFSWRKTALSHQKVYKSII